MTTVQPTFPEDIVAAAIDDPNPQSIIIGHGKLALRTDYYSDDDSVESNTYKSFTNNPQALPPLQGTRVTSPTIRGNKRSQLNVGNINYEGEHPHQFNLTVAGRTADEFS